MLLRTVLYSITYKAFLPPANEVCKGYLFTDICLSTGGFSLCLGSLCQENPWTETLPGQTPHWTEIPGQRPLDRGPLDRDPLCESLKSHLRWRHACYCLEQNDLVSPGIQIKDPQSVSPQWGSAAGMKRCCQQAGMGIKGTAASVKGELRLGIHTGQFDAVSVTPPWQRVATTSCEWRITRHTVLIKAGHWMCLASPVKSCLRRWDITRGYIPCVELVYPWMYWNST